MDVNVTPESVHVSASIEAWFQTREPQDSVHDSALGHALPFVADGAASFEYGSRDSASPNLL
jgi:hypothetical protein